jgi:fructose-bisphosphate aldolase class II
MQSLRKEIEKAQAHNVAIGHFNVSDLAGLKAIFAAAYALKAPVIIGTSEGEREFLGPRQIAALVRSLREEFDFPIFLNADHTHSFEKAKEAVEAGYDAVLFDGGRKTLAENIEDTRQVVEYVREYNASHAADILVEGELGYIGSSSVLLEAIPEGAAIHEKDLTTPAEAEEFVRKTGVDLLAPAVGNIHGMFKDAPNPNLNIDRIKALREAVSVPLVLHGGSGITSQQFAFAIDAGISIIHINTELRMAWRRGFDLASLAQPNEIVPYKLLHDVIDSIEQAVAGKLKIFNRIDADR